MKKRGSASGHQSSGTQSHLAIAGGDGTNFPRQIFVPRQLLSSNPFELLAFLNARVQTLEGQVQGFFGGVQRIEALERQVQSFSAVNQVFVDAQSARAGLAARDQELVQVRADSTQALVAKDQELEQVRADSTRDLAARDQELEQVRADSTQALAARDQELVQVRADGVRDLAAKDQELEQVRADSTQALEDQHEEALLEKERALEAQELAFKAEVMRTGMYAVENVDVLINTGNFLLKKSGSDYVLPKVSNLVKGIGHFVLAFANYDYSGSVTSLVSTAVLNTKLFSNYIIPQGLQDKYNDVVTEYPYAKCAVDAGVSFASNAAIFSPQAALPYAALSAASCAAEIAQPGTGFYVTAATSSLKMMFSGNSVTKAIDALVIVDTFDAYDTITDFLSVLGGVNHAAVESL